MIKDMLINGRWKLTLPDSSADEWQGNMKFHDNQWELKRLLKLEELIKGGKRNVLYIGAYKGDMAALLASWGANVVMVESTPGFWGIIKKTWDINRLPKPPAFFSGLISNRTEGADGIHLDEWPMRTTEYVEGQVGFTHLAESKDDPTFPEITIDDLIGRTGFIPEVITMDIEGSEFEALKGAGNTISSIKPDFVLSIHPEFMFHNYQEYERHLHDFLRDHGYIGEWLDYDHEHHWYYRYGGEK